MKLRGKRLFGLIAVLALALCALFAFAACDFDLNTDREVESISVNAENAKTTFVQNEEFTTKGLVVIATFTDGTTSRIRSGYHTTTPDMSVLGEQEVVVTYGIGSDSYKITIEEGEPEPEPTLTGIYATVGTNEAHFFVGDTFTFANLKVFAKYSNKTEKEVTEGYTVSVKGESAEGYVFKAEDAGKVSVTVAYEGYKTNYQVDVEAVVVTGITLDAEGPKAFLVGEAFSWEGLVVVAHKNNGTDETLTEGYDVTLEKDGAEVALAEGKFAEAGTYTVVVSYLTFTAEYTVEVTKPHVPLTKDEVTFATTDATVLAEDGHVYFILTGSYTVVDSYDSVVVTDEVVAILGENYVLDFQRNGYYNPDKDFSYRYDYELDPVRTAENDTWTLKVCVDTLWVDVQNSTYVCHFGLIDSSYPNLKISAAKEESVKIENISYSVIYKPEGPDTAANYWRAVGFAITSDAHSYSIDMSTAKIENVEGRAILSVNGTVTGYTESEISFDLEYADTGDFKFSVTDLDYTLTIENATLTIKADITDVPIASQYVVHIRILTANIDLEDLDKTFETPSEVTIGTRVFTLGIVSKWSRPMILLGVDDTTKDIVWTYATLTSDNEENPTKVFIALTGIFTGFVEADLARTEFIGNEAADVVKLDHYVKGDAEGVYTLYFDLTKGRASADGVLWYGHFRINGDKIGKTDGGDVSTAGDIKFLGENDGNVDLSKKYVIGTKIYSMFYEFHMPVPTIREASADLNFYDVELKVDESASKVYYVISAITNYSEADIIAKLEFRDVATIRVEKVELDGIYAKIYFDITNLFDTETDGQFYPHAHYDGKTFDGGSTGDVKFKGIAAQTVSFGGKTYKIEQQYDMPKIVRG